MRTLDPDVIAAYQAGRIVKRNLLWITGRDRDTGDLHSIGFWDEVEAATITVNDGFGAGAVSRAFNAAGGLISVGNVPLTSDLSIRNVDVAISPLNADADQYLRGYDLKMQPVQIWRPLFDPDTWEIVANPEPRFVGFVDKAPVITPAEGGQATATLSCVSHTVELTRFNPDVRSDESQKLRGGDRQYQYTGVMGTRKIYWGANP